MDVNFLGGIGTLNMAAMADMFNSPASVLLGVENTTAAVSTTESQDGNARSELSAIVVTSQPSCSGIEAE